MNATTTHDTKRSEDVNARINVLSEQPGQWTRHLSWWRRCNYSYRQSIEGQWAPDPNLEELLYQSLVGAWPLKPEEIIDFKERFKAYLLKAIREAKSFTGWIRPDEPYEKAVMDFTDSILKESPENEFLPDFLAFQKETAFYGAINALGQVLLKITSPGVPDFYQGTELWDLSLVDPDNRRPVDYHLRDNLLQQIQEQEHQDQMALIEEVLKHWPDGRVKLYLTYKALHLRQMYPVLFRQGEYCPLAAEGYRKEHVLAFARTWQNTRVITVIPRLASHITELWSFPLGDGVWKKDTLILPDEAPAEWINVFTGEPVIAAGNQRLRLSQIFNSFPVALLINATGQPV